MKCCALWLLALLFWTAEVSVRAEVVSTNSTAPVSTAVGKKRFIVTLERGVSPDGFCTRRGFKVLRQTKSSPNGFAAHRTADTALILPGLKMVICDLSEDEARAARGETGVRWVEADGNVAPCGQVIPSGLVRIGADHFPVAHINGTLKALNVDVAILDTGIDVHEDLPATYQWFSLFDDNPGDVAGHGTAVAGALAALDNGLGVVGVAPGVRLWNVKCIGNPAGSSWTDALGGMEFAYENADQISVANMSFANVPWGSTSPYNAIRLAVQNMVNAGVVVVAAVANNTNDIAGPDGVFGEIPGGPQSDDVVPAGLPEAMAVSAMDPTNDVMAFFSNFSQVARTNDPVTGMTNYISSPGGAIDVAAPGVHIYTTFPIAIGTNVYGSNRYGWFDGTSLAAPHVAGLVALYIAANGRATNAEGVYRIRQAIVDASLPQSQWRTNNTHDPDTNPEPLAIASEKWVPMPVITNVSGTPANFRLSFNAVPGYDYTLQSATELGTGGSWTNGATVSGSNFVAAVSVTDTNAAGQKFFKLLRSPSP